MFFDQWQKKKENYMIYEWKIIYKKEREWKKEINHKNYMTYEWKIIYEKGEE